MSNCHGMSKVMELRTLLWTDTNFLILVVTSGKPQGKTVQDDMVRGMAIETMSQMSSASTKMSAISLGSAIGRRLVSAGQKGRNRGQGTGANRSGMLRVMAQNVRLEAQNKDLAKRMGSMQSASDLDYRRERQDLLTTVACLKAKAMV